MEWIAHEYDNFQKHFQFQYGLQLLSALESAVSLEHKSVLDLGCGTGDLTLVLNKKVGPAGHVTALDRDPNMLSAFREKLGSEQIELVSGDLNDWLLMAESAHRHAMPSGYVHRVETLTTHGNTRRRQGA